jgi:hypothetical protein
MLFSWQKKIVLKMFGLDMHREVFLGGQNRNFSPLQEKPE